MIILNFLILSTILKNILFINAVSDIRLEYCTKFRSSIMYNEASRTWEGRKGKYFQCTEC